MEEQERRGVEYERLDFEQNFWFQHDLDRDYEMTLSELATGDVTIDAALEIFEILNIDPVSDNLQFEVARTGLLEYA